MNLISESSKLTEEEYSYLLFVHYTWWKESKLVKGTNNRRYITWATDGHHWKVDGLDYGLDYVLPYTESYKANFGRLSAAQVKDYVKRHLI
jgi:hypothetical protein